MEELYNGQDCVDFILTDSAKKYNFESNLDRTKYINEALNYISKFANPEEQEIYLGVVQKLVRIPIDVLKKSLTKSEQKEIVEEEPEINTQNMKDNAIRESKIFILASMLYKKIKNLEETESLFLQADELQYLYEFLKERIENNKDYNVSSLFDSFEISSNSLIDQIINYDFPKDFETYLADTIKTVR